MRDFFSDHCVALVRSVRPGSVTCFVDQHRVQYADWTSFRSSRRYQLSRRRPVTTPHVPQTYYPRLNNITILVDTDKCYAIISQSDKLRQCNNKRTETGDPEICSAKHTLSWGKVREPMIFEEGLIDFLR